jgi:hypothetical protein
MTYNPGDIEVVELKVTSNGGESMDFTTSFISFDIYESIFAPGIIAYIAILDGKNIVNTAKLAGGEEVSFAFATPGGQAAEYKFVLNSLKDAESPEGQHSRSYMLECVSQEAFDARSKYVSKKYDLKMYSEIVQDIFENDDFIGSKKKLDVEETKGMFRYVVPNTKPYQAIDLIRRRSVSSENKSSSFVFFENRDGFYFKTIEKIFKEGSVIKEYVQNETIGNDFMNSNPNNIIALETPQQGSMSKTIASGNMSQDYRTYNFQTLDYKKKNVKDPSKGMSSGGSDPDDRIPQKLKDKYGKEDKPNKISVVPANNEKQLGAGRNTEIGMTSPGQMAYADALASSTVKISVFGDTDLKAGVLIKANLLQKSDATTDPGTDSSLSGKFLVSALRHMVRQPGVRPRYTCEMELVKGGYEESYQ